MESVWLEHSPLLFRKEWKEIAKAKSKYHVDISEQGKKNRTYKGVTYDSLTELRFLQEYIEPKMKSGEILSYERQVEYVLQDKFKYNGKTILPTGGHGPPFKNCCLNKDKSLDASSIELEAPKDIRIVPTGFVEIVQRFEIHFALVWFSLPNADISSGFQFKAVNPAPGLQWPPKRAITSKTEKQNWIS